jgi:hypothetical protein
MAMVKRRQNRKLPKQIATPTMEGRRKEKISCKIWRDEVKFDFNTPYFSMHVSRNNSCVLGQ